LRDFHRIAQPVHGDLRFHDVLCTGRKDRGVDLTRSDCVDANAIAPKIERLLPCQRG
jgi:hypothetical protein